MKKKYRIIFDNNRPMTEFGYPLDLACSKMDLEKMGDELQNGVEVIIYEPNDFELLATLRYDKTHGYWCAFPLPSSN